MKNPSVDPRTLENMLRRFIRWVATNVPPEKWIDLWPAAKELEAMVSNDE